MKFTRSVNTYKATAYDLQMVDGQAVANELGTCEYQSTRSNKGEARKNLKAAGVVCPKGCTIEIKPVSRETYGCTVEEFMTVAHLVSKEDL